MPPSVQPFGEHVSIFHQARSKLDNCSTPEGWCLLCPLSEAGLASRSCTSRHPLRDKKEISVFKEYMEGRGPAADLVFPGNCHREVLAWPDE